MIVLTIQPGTKLQKQLFVVPFLPGFHHGLHLRHDPPYGVPVCLQQQYQHEGLHQQQPVRIQNTDKTTKYD